MMEGIYLVTDRKLIQGKSWLYVVEEAVKGGVSLVQLREKEISTREFIELGLALKQVLAPYQVPLLVNDRVDVALAIGAEGVHIGQSDMPYPVARALLGEKALIGLSVETQEQVLLANQWEVDYIALSPVFPTPTKTDTHTPWGLEGIKAARKISKHPIVGIGGIHQHNAPEVVQAGVSMLAVVSEICTAEAPYQAAKNLLNVFNYSKPQTNI
ncbi:thiamine phosphate synthase [Rapidithrix thailandica]|uniref:Thiamine-phosphate synthase n=1 Tax=Rapidithrix thailandica TaxID=413964 RepID=A0AAW9RW10_9BACT